MLKTKNNNLKENLNLNIQKGIFFILPYVKGLSERLKNEFKKFQIQIFFKNTNNLSSLFSNCKDKDEKELKSGVVYRIPSKDCTKCYVGQTSRYLKKKKNLWT